MRRDKEYLSVFSSNAGKCGKNADQNNSEYGLFLRSVASSVNVIEIKTAPISLMLSTCSKSIMAAPEACVKSFQRRLFRVFVADSGVSIVELKQVNINCVQECSKAS